MPLGAILGVGGAILSGIGGQRAAKEQRRAERRRQRAMQAALADHDQRMQPIKAHLQTQIGGALTPEERRLREQYLMMQRGQQERDMARAYQRGLRAWAPFGEQHTERALRFGQETERDAAQRLYDANVRHAMGLQQLTGQRAQHATSMLAQLQAERLRTAMGLAGATPMTTSGVGEGLGRIGSALIGMGAEMFMNRAPRANVPVQTPGETPRPLARTMNEFLAMPASSSFGAGTAVPATGLAAPAPAFVLGAGIGAPTGAAIPFTAVTPQGMGSPQAARFALDIPRTERLGASIAPPVMSVFDPQAPQARQRSARLPIHGAF